MRPFLALPLCLFAIACQSSQYVTRDELRDLLVLPAATDEDSSVKMQPWDIDDLVAGAFSAPQPATRAAAALATTDEKLKPLASALAAIDKAFDVCANNLANAETTAFKRTSAASDPGGQAIFRPDFEQGALENSGRQLDIAIQGNGFFRVKTITDFAYTRNGNFFVNNNGNLVLGMGDGYHLDPKINVPKGVTDISISNDGKVSVTKAGMLAPAIIGQLAIYQFHNPQGLKLLGGSLYTQTDQSGQPAEHKPGHDGAGEVIQGFLECSNVNPTKERLRMRFLQNWRATILRAIDDSKSNKPEAINAHAKNVNTESRSEFPVVASVVAGPDSPPKSHTTSIDAHRLSPLATALNVIDVEVDVCANNLANAKTTGFKRSRVNLEDLQPLTLKPPGTTTAKGDISPSGISQGQGVKISNTQLDTEQGAMENTGRQLDIGIQGQGFFKVKIFPEIADGTGYTRNGNFFVNKNGDLALGSPDGYILDPKINIPKGTLDISISTDGKISITQGGKSAPQIAGQIELYQFINPQGLNLLGASTYTETQSSGSALQSKPGEDGAGQLLQGFLEASNVDLIKERLKMRFLQNWRSMILSAID